MRLKSPLISGVDTQRPDPLDRNAPGHVRLLDAVLCLLVEDGTRLLAAAVTPDEVARRSGKSRASYYRTEGFPGSDALEADTRVAVLEAALAAALRATDDLVPLSEAIGQFVDGAWRGISPEQFIRMAAEGNFATYQTYSTTALMFAAALAPSSSVIADELRRYFDNIVGEYSLAYERLLAAAGYRLRPGVTLDEFTTVVMAVADGLALRACGDERVTSTLFAVSIETVAMSMLVADGDVAEATRPTNFRRPTDAKAPTRSSILEGFNQLMSAEHAELPTLEALADVVGCSEVAIRTSFGGVVGVLKAAWAEWQPEFEEVADRERTSRGAPDPLSALYRVAIEVATRALQQMPISRALLMSEAGTVVSRRRSSIDPVTALFGRLLDEAANAGHFRAPEVRADGAGLGRNLLFAHTLRTNLLLMVVANQNDVADQSELARHIVDYVWAALMPPRRATTRQR